MNDYLFVSSNDNSLTEDVVKNLIRLADEDTPKIVFFLGCQDNSPSALRENIEVLFPIMTKFADKGSQVVFVNGTNQYFRYFLHTTINKIKCFDFIETFETKSEIFVICPTIPALFPPKEIAIKNKNKKIILVYSAPFAGPMTKNEKRNSAHIYIKQLFEDLNFSFAIQNTSNNSENPTELKKYVFKDKDVYTPATSGSFINRSIF